MKKLLFIATSMLSLFTASCSNKDIIEYDYNKVEADKTITLNANINNGTDTRMTYEDDANNKTLKFNWSTSEKFNLYQGTSSTATEFTKNSAGNTFSGTAPTESTGTYYAVYGENITNTNGKLSMDISTQKGTVAWGVYCNSKKNLRKINLSKK